MFKYLVIIVINILVASIYGIDKYKAIKKRERISEITLLTLSAFAPLGALLGMLTFHHKTKKIKFKLTIPILLIIHILIYTNYFI